MSHLSPGDASRWVAGLLEGGEADRFERHARVCPSCEALLTSEARVEVALATALAALPVPGPRRARSARLAVVLVPLALAASLAVFLVSRAAEEDHSLTSAPHYEHDHQVPLSSLVALGPAAL